MERGHPFTEVQRTSKLDTLFSKLSVAKRNPLDFDQFLPWACKQFLANVTVNATTQPQPKSERGRSRMMKRLSVKKGRELESEKTVVMSYESTDESMFTKVLTTYDNQHNLVGININNTYEAIPRYFFKMLALIIEFYPLLTNVTIKKGLDSYSIHEISKLLPLSNITEIVLDGTYLSSPNYFMLLESTCKLNYLSLARCAIGDDDLKRIAENLADGKPCEKTLIFLNLSSNKITDIGAGYLAVALRSNRHLAYLNLAGNDITDKGASDILDTLQEFCLQKKEVIESRIRHMKYLKSKEEFIAKFLAENKKKLEEKVEIIPEHQTAVEDTPKKREEKILKHKVKKKEADIKQYPIVIENLQYKAETLAVQTLGAFNDPFINDKSYIKNGKNYFIGNNNLTCLNVAYNNLTIEFLKKLLNVLRYQEHLVQKPRGLLRVRFEGNFMPQYCEEYDEINLLLESSLLSQVDEPKKNDFMKVKRR